MRRLKLLSLAAAGLWGLAFAALGAVVYRRGRLRYTGVGL